MATEPKRARTRRAMLLAARELLEVDGPDYVGMAEVARKAGVTRQTVYEHFGSRSGLLLALVDWVDESEGIAEHVRPMREARDGAEALERFVETVAVMTPRIHAVARAIYRERGRDPAAARAWEDRMRRRRSDAHRVAKMLREEGRLTPSWSVGSAADWIWAVTSIPAWEHLVVERGWSEKRYRSHVADALLRTLVSHQAKPPK